jgi:hypothetical protein
MDDGQISKLSHSEWMILFSNISRPNTGNYDGNDNELATKLRF